MAVTLTLSPVQVRKRARLEAHGYRVAVSFDAAAQPGEPYFVDVIDPAVPRRMVHVSATSADAAMDSAFTQVAVVLAWEEREQWDFGVD